MIKNKFLRTIPVFCIFISAIFCSTKMHAQDVRDSLIADGDNYLEMTGKVLQSMGQQRDEDKKGLDSAEVHVTNESGKEVLFGLTDSKGRLTFRLPLSRKFTLSISKKGFVKKSISVDTHVPADDRKNYSFAFDIDIFESVPGLDVSVLNEPVAKVVFRPLNKSFTYDATYTSKVNAGLQKMYRDYYAMEKKQDVATDSVSVPTKPIIVKSSGTDKSVTYGKNTKTHPKN